MEQYLKIVGLAIGVIAGLLGLLKAIVELRKQYREDKSLSALLAGRQFKIAAGFTLIGFVALFGIVWRSMPGDQTSLIIQVWDVELDEKHAILASQHFPNISGLILSEDELEQIGNWFVEQVGRKYGLNAEALQIHLYVPADLSNEQLDIEVTPTGPDQVYFWIVNEGKSRVPLNEHALAQVGEDFYLEISRPGYKKAVIEVPWGQMLDQNFTVEPQSVSIGVEEFDGEENSVATQLADYLSKNPRFTITDPGTLEERKEKIAEEKTFIEENPMIQDAIRTSLGVDLIISGLYERH